MVASTFPGGFPFDSFPSRNLNPLLLSSAVEYRSKERPSRRERTRDRAGVRAMSQTLASPTSASALPPGPPSPAWWQLVRFTGGPLGVLDEGHHIYGDAFTLNIAGYGRFVM